MAGRLRVGVIGLGRRWQRYYRALHRLQAQLEVRAVCDEVLQRAERTAQALSCAAAPAPLDLLERSDIDAVLLLDPQWFGLWPLEYACRLGRPILCATSLIHDDSHADSLHAQVQASGLPVFVDLPPLLAPASARLAELLRGPLGPPRLLHVSHSLTADCHSSDGGVLLSTPALLGLLALCGRLLGEAPASIQALTGSSAVMACVQMDFSGGRGAQISLWRGVRPGCRIVAEGSEGQVRVRLPHRLSWDEGTSRHGQRLPRRSRAVHALERFVRCLKECRPPEPALAEAHRALTWLRAARRSLHEGRRIALAEAETASG